MFRRLSIPTPFQVGPVNAYVAGRTLVDPGPDSEEAWSTLLEELEVRELAPADVEQVLITHPHPDHFGLARRLREAGARVLASPTTASIIEDFEGRLEFEQAFFVDFFQRHGMAESTARTVTELPEAFLAYAPSTGVDRNLSDGDAVTVADENVVAERVEGHAPGELIFSYNVDGSEREHPKATTDRSESGDRAEEAVVGDHVLPDITPNPFLQPPPTESDERPRVLPAFNRSLDRLRERGFERLLPGHREIVSDPADRIATIREAHEQRTERVAGLVDDPTTAVEVMEGLFEDLPVTEQFSGMSEAVGHLDVLEARGLVERDERGGMVVYEAVR